MAKKQSLRSINVDDVKYTASNGFTCDGHPLWLDTGKVTAAYGLVDNCIQLDLDEARMASLTQIASKADIRLPEPFRIYLNRYTRVFDLNRTLLSDTRELERPCTISVLLNCSTVNDCSAWNLWPSQIRVWRSDELPVGCQEYYSTTPSSLACLHTKQ